MLFHKNGEGTIYFEHISSDATAIDNHLICGNDVFYKWLVWEGRKRNHICRWNPWPTEKFITSRIKNLQFFHDSSIWLIKLSISACMNQILTNVGSNSETLRRKVWTKLCLRRVIHSGVIVDVKNLLEHSLLRIPHESKNCWVFISDSQLHMILVSLIYEDWIGQSISATTRIRIIILMLLYYRTSKSISTKSSWSIRIIQFIICFEYSFILSNIIDLSISWAPHSDIQVIRFHLNICLCVKI